jgi:hypothetical protein
MLQTHSTLSFVEYPSEHSFQCEPIILFVSRTPSVLQWWFVESTEKTPILFSTFVIPVKATIWSIAIDERRHFLLCGDSKGTLYFFHIPTTKTGKHSLFIHLVLLTSCFDVDKIVLLYYFLTFLMFFSL